MLLSINSVGAICSHFAGDLPAAHARVLQATLRLLRLAPKLIHRVAVSRAVPTLGDLSKNRPVASTRAAKTSIDDTTQRALDRGETPADFDSVDKFWKLLIEGKAQKTVSVR